MDGLGSTKERICYRFKGTSSVADRSMAVMGIKPILLRSSSSGSQQLGCVLILNIVLEAIDKYIEHWDRSTRQQTITCSSSRRWPRDNTYLRSERASRTTTTAPGGGREKVTVNENPYLLITKCIMRIILVY